MATDTAAVSLTLYSRKGCHLCDEMISLLQEFSTDYTYKVEIIDIDTDPVLKERFNEWVPALYQGTEEICHHFFDLESLKTALNRQYTS